MLITWLSLCWVFLSSAQEVIEPQHNCNNFFYYELRDNDYKGIFTAPLGANLPHQWKASFQINGHREVFVSPLMPYPNKGVSESNILNGQPAKTFVQFRNISNELPQLKHLSLNGWTLCLNPGCK
ncbi:hypothetical protein KR084_001992 [Drosophila pseudotakahashii]|nr:hypothetical protein KR084_001992 [Drosophila pseudotakahashii]